MGYVLSAVIAATDVLRRHATGNGDIIVVELRQSLSLIPISDQLHDRAAHAAKHEPDP